MNTNWFSTWAIPVSTFVPVIGALIMLFMPKREELKIKTFALITSLISLGVGVGILGQYNYSRAGMQFEVNISWIDAIGTRFHVGLDGISLWMFMLTLLVVPLCIIYSWNHFPKPHNPKMFLILLLLLQTGMLGTFVALDLILFFVFFEVTLLPMYFIIGIWGGPRRMYAAIKFFLFTLFGSAFMLVAFLAIYFIAEPHTFDIVLLSELGIVDVGRAAGLWIFAGLFIGFAIKVPMWPFHTWLPDAHTEAPTVGSVVLAAVLLKMGTYGFIRIALPIMPDAARDWAPVIGLLAVIGIIYGSLACLAQKDVKRLIAFSSVGHMGFIMLAIATLTPLGINAAVFGMVAHGIVTGMLFFLAGSIGERYGTRDISKLGGLINSVPHMGGLLVFISFASLGLPALAGFPGEFAALLAAFNPAPGLNVWLFRSFMIVAAIGTVLTAGYLLYMLQRVAQGPVPTKYTGDGALLLRDVNTIEYVSWTPLIILTVVLGIFPGIIFNIVNETSLPLFGGIFG